MKRLFDLSGRTAVVTGSSRGIGRSIAEALAAHGANVVISSRNQAACDAVAAAINARDGGRALAVGASISAKPQLTNLIDRAEQTYGPVDILVCNAASNPHHGPSQDISDDQFLKILQNNVLSTHWLVQLVAPKMRKRGGGSIIIVSSVGGYRGSPVIGAYNISKAADFQLARNLAVEYGADGVRVNCIAPGLIRTDFARALWDDPDNLAAALRGTPMQRIGEPEEIAGAAVFLAADASRYMTGQTVIVDGGATTTLGGV